MPLRFTGVRFLAGANPDPLHKNIGGHVHECLGEYFHSLFPNDNAIAREFTNWFEEYCACVHADIDSNVAVGATSATPSPRSPATQRRSITSSEGSPEPAIATSAPRRHLRSRSEQTSLMTRLEADATELEDASEVEEVMSLYPNIFEWKSHKHSKLLPPHHPAGRDARLNGNARIARDRGEIDQIGRRLVRDLSFASAVSILPKRIWQDPWVAAEVTPKYNYEEFWDQIFDDATLNTTVRNSPTLRVSGIGMDACVDALQRKMREAAAASDFSTILSPNQIFEV